MILRVLASCFAAALTAALGFPAFAADDPGAVRTLLERVVAGNQGTTGEAKRAQITVGALPTGVVLPPLPPDARVVGSIVRATSGIVLYLDVPGAPGDVLTALERTYATAGYTKSALPGQGGFSTATSAAPNFFCKGDDAVSIQANGDGITPLAHVDVSLLHGNLAKTLCGGANGFAALSATFLSTIPSLRPSDGMTIDGSTTGISTGAGAFLGNGSRPSTAWGHITTAMTLSAVTTALAAQLTTAGWTTSAPAVVAGATAYERFTTPATATAAAGDALLTVTKGPANTYDAFIRAIVPAKG